MPIASISPHNDGVVYFSFCFGCRDEPRLGSGSLACWSVNEGDEIVCNSTSRNE